MRTFAIKQAMFFPLGAMLALMLVGFTVHGYSSTSQQMSELGLLAGYPAAFESVLAIIVGASVIVFGLGLIGHPSGRFAFTAGTSIVFGVSMLSNGIFTMGSPLHGMYAIGFSVILTPVLFVAELHTSQQTQTTRIVSMWVAVITLLYFWATITRFDPKGFHGLTQRLSVIIMFGWFSYASYTLSHSKTKDGVVPSRALPAEG
jgi:hypothetical protein